VGTAAARSSGRRHRRQGRTLADSEQERASVQSMLEFFDRAAAPAGAQK
jgi:hypothetical protein